MKKRVFLSFKSEDKQKVLGIKRLATHPEFDIDFFESPDRIPITNENNVSIRQKIKEKIARTYVTVCMIGTHTHASEWVRLELEESIKNGNELIVMALKDISWAAMPEPVLQSKSLFHPWDYDLLFQFIESA